MTHTLSRYLSTSAFELYLSSQPAVKREAFSSLHFLKKEELPGSYQETCWRSQSYRRPGNPKSETHMVTIIPSFLQDHVKRHFLAVRESLTNRLIIHECISLMGLRRPGRALGQRFQLETCECFCLWELCFWKEPVYGRKSEFAPCFSWGNMAGGSKQLQELYCSLTRAFAGRGVRYFLYIESYLLTELPLSPGDLEQRCSFHPSLDRKQ